MQDSSVAFKAILSGGVNNNPADVTRDLLDLVEFYLSSYEPGATGFDPASATQRFSSIEFTFLARSYRRSALSRSDVVRFFGKQTNTCTVNFSNADENRYVANWVQTTSVEGMWMVVRTVSRSASVTLDDSQVIFVGRCQKPGDFDEIRGSITAEQSFGPINYEIPARNYGPLDPLGRSPLDPEFEGFRFKPVSISLTLKRREPRGGILGIFGFKKTVYYTVQYSSVSDLDQNESIPIVLGRCQLLGKVIAAVDAGTNLRVLYAFCEGPIDAYENLRKVSPELVGPQFIHYRYGLKGGTGTQVPIVTVPADFYPANGYFSYTAFIAAYFSGSTEETQDPAPEVAAIIKGMIVPLPDGSGNFTLSGWTHSPAYLARFILTDTRLGLRFKPSFIEDSVCIETAAFQSEALLDISEGERVFIPDPDLLEAGNLFRRYRSTGLYNSARVGFGLGILPADPFLGESDYEGFDPFDAFPVIVSRSFLRERYTANVPITDKVPARDFLFNTLCAAARMYLVFNRRGKIEIRSEKAEDHTRLRSATIATATAIPVEDVTPWKTSLKGRLLTGFGLATSEVRDATAADYTADANTITLTAAGAGGMTATASGATLAGGTGAVQASGTITVGGTPGVGRTISVTIQGRTVTFVLDSDATTTEIAAGMLKHHINADPVLRRFIVAEWTSGVVVTVKAKWGVLTVAALANAHAGPVANPSSGPVLASSAGLLAAGTYYLAYAYLTAAGKSILSPVTSIVLAASKKIDVSAITPLPANVLSADWFMSRQPNDASLIWAANNSGAAFSLNALPLAGAAQPPSFNTTAEELIRIAYSFATNNQGASVLAQAGLTRGNIFDGTYKWPLPGRQLSTNQAIGKFRDATNDFALTPLEINDLTHQAQVNKISKVEIDLSAVDNLHQARRLLNATLSKNREGDWFNALESSAQAMLLEEGDLICSSDDSGGHVNALTRIEELRLTPTWDVKVGAARRYSTLMFSDEVEAHTIPLSTTLKFVTPIPTLLDFMDIALWKDEDGAKGPGFYASLSWDLALKGDWSGSTLWADYGKGYVQIAESDSPATTGAATTTLGTGITSTWDTVSTVRVVVKQGTLSNATDDQVLKGANKFRIGQEILYAANAVLVGGTTDTYDLSRFLRGRHGTEWAVSTHTSTDGFTVLDPGPVFFVPIELVHLRVPRPYKAVTTNQDLADVSPVTYTWEAESLKPLSPSRVEGRRNSANDILLTCNLRSRAGQALRDLSGPPRAEEREVVIWEIMSGSTVMRTIRVEGATPIPSLWKVRDSQPSPAAFYVDSAGTVTVSEGTYGEGSGVAEMDIPLGADILIEATVDSAFNSALPVVGLAPNALQLNNNKYGVTLGTEVLFYFKGRENTSNPNHFVRAEGLAGAETGTVPGDRISMRIKSGVVDYFKNYTGELSRPFYTSKKVFNPAGASKLIAHGRSVEYPLNGIAQAQYVRIALFRAAFYTAAMQTEDGFTPGNAITVRVSQESALVGRGHYTQVVL